MKLKKIYMCIYGTLELRALSQIYLFIYLIFFFNFMAFYIFKPCVS